MLAYVDDVTTAPEVRGTSATTTAIGETSTIEVVWDVTKHSSIAVQIGAHIIFSGATSATLITSLTTHTPAYLVTAVP